MRPLAFKLIPGEFFEKLIILSKMDENNFFEKYVLELCRTAMIKPTQIECSGLFLLDHNVQTCIYRLVSGQSYAWLWRNHDFLTEDDDLKKCALELCRTTTMKPRQIERSVFFSTGPQRTNLNLQTGLRSIGCLVVEKSRFSDRA